MSTKTYRRLFEFEDLHWFPNIIREGMTDYLRYVLTLTNFYQPVTPIIVEGITQTNAAAIIDLCSGGGGAIEQIKNNLAQHANCQIPIILTDKFPNINAYKFLSEKTNGSVSFSEISVDATAVPPELKGFRTIFSGFHHFNKSAATSVLKNAVDAKSGIGIFDGGDRNIFITIVITLLHPVAFFLFTPFFRPYRFSRFLFTYLIPIIPLCTMWDGIVSIFRLYSPKELLDITTAIDNENYTWKAGKLKNKMGLHVTFLIGYPLVK